MRSPQVGPDPLSRPKHGCTIPMTNIGGLRLTWAAQGDSNDPVTWLALGAGWSGGALLAHPQHLVPVPAYMTPRAARIAILLSARIL